MTFRGTDSIEDHAKHQRCLAVRKKFVVIGVSLALASSIAVRRVTKSLSCELRLPKGTLSSLNVPIEELYE